MFPVLVFCGGIDIADLTKDFLETGPNYIQIIPVLIPTDKKALGKKYLGWALVKK